MPEGDAGSSEEPPERSHSMAERRVRSVKHATASAGLFGLTVLGMVFVADRYGDAFSPIWGALWIVMAAIGSFAAARAIVLWSPPERDGMMLEPFFWIAGAVIALVVVLILYAGL